MNKRDKKGKTRWYRRKWQKKYSKMWKLQMLISGAVLCPAKATCGNWCKAQFSHIDCPPSWCRKHIVAAYERMLA